MASQTWWLFQGAPDNIKKGYKTIRTGGGTLVMDKATTFYLRMQSSETAFVGKIAKDYNLDPKEVTQPKYGSTPCGRLSTTPLIHSRSCRSCQQLKRNAAAAVGIEIPVRGLDGLPVKERQIIWDNAVAVAAEAEVDAKAAAEEVLLPVEDNAVVEKPLTPTELQNYLPDRVGTLAQRNVLKAEEASTKASALFEQALYWDGVAAMYTAFGEPTAKVAEAQKALDEAKSKEESERNEQRIALELILKQGPPGS